MRKNANSMLGFSIMATDGELGKVKDFYFDDASWTLRYMVVKTGNWLSGRKVLISFASVEKIDCESSTFSVNLSCEQVRDSPDIDTDKPLYRQHELELHEHYMLPAYWLNTSGMNWGINDTIFPATELPELQEDKQKEASEHQHDNQHLRSIHQLEGYLIHAVDGEIGHVKDFIIDQKDWIITFLLIETRNLLAGRKVLLSTQKITRMEWADSEVYVSVSRAFIIDSPEFDLDKDL